MYVHVKYYMLCYVMLWGHESAIPATDGLLVPSCFRSIAT